MVTSLPPAAIAAFSSRSRPSALVTPGCTPANTRTALACWKRFERGAVGVTDLRDHLVAALEEVEAVHVSTAQQRAELAAHAGEIQAEVRDALTVEHHARLGQVDLQIAVHVQELAALPAGAD